MNYVNLNIFTYIRQSCTNGGEDKVLIMIITFITNIRTNIINYTDIWNRSI